MHPEAVIEERGDSTSTVREEPLKSSVQALRKGRILLIEMNQIGRPLRLKLVTLLLKVSDSAGFRIILPREDEDDVATLVLDRHSVGERILASHPPKVNP
jgi:hypothetical protein